MGYRSEVAIALKPQAFTALIEGIPENTQHVKSLIDEAEVTKQENGILLYWDSIKWYEMNADIHAFMESLQKLDNEDWIFFEIGEELEDMTINGHWWGNPFNLNISRSIYKET